MTKQKTLSIFLISCSMMFFVACKKISCYSEELYQASKNNICKTDCPGVKGCDGKTYCHSCDAARKGIKVK